MLNGLLCFAVNPSEAVTLGCVNEVLLVIYMFSHGCVVISRLRFFRNGSPKNMAWTELNESGALDSKLWAPDYVRVITRNIFSRGN